MEKPSVDLSELESRNHYLDFIYLFFSQLVFASFLNKQNNFIFPQLISNISKAIDRTQEVEKRGGQGRVAGDKCQELFVAKG